LVCSQYTPMFCHVEQLGGVIVRESWVLDCFLEKRKLDESNYIFHGAIDEKLDTTKEPQIFSDLVILLYGILSHEDELKSQIILHGGKMASKASQFVTHILTENSPASKDVLSFCAQHVCVVDSAWAWESISKQALLSERVYMRNKL